MLKRLRVLAWEFFSKLHVSLQRMKEINDLLSLWSFQELLVWSLQCKLRIMKCVSISFPFNVKGGDPAALSSTATLLRLHPPH